MSGQHPECPLSVHANCRQFHNPGLCAIARKDKTCLKELAGAQECICPRCGRAHTLKFFWSGAGTPRKYCEACFGYRRLISALEYPLHLEQNRPV